MRKILFLVIFLIICLGVVTIFYLKGILQFNHPDLARYPTRGIDVSHHQGAIDWMRVKNDGISFVYMKASEGGDFRDKRFEENYAGAMKAGLETGAYHFFTLCRKGEEQAENFIGATAGKTMDLPPAIDLEYVGNCAARPDRKAFLNELGAFAFALSEEGYKNPVLYTTHSFYDDYLSGTPYALFPLWVRDIWKEPDTSKYPSMTLWQYADRARVNGIDGPVDLNVRRARP